MRYLAMIVVLLTPVAVLAQPTYLSCSSNCPSRYYWETAPLTRAAPSAAPVDGTVGSGMKLNSIVGGWIELCAASGQTLSGAGTLDAYYYDLAAALWFRNPLLDLAVSVTATSCAGSPCRCQIFPDLPVAAVKGGYILYATNGVTVSGGTTVVVRVDGSL